MIALIITLAFALTSVSPMLAQPKESAPKTDKRVTATKKEPLVKNQIVAKQK